MNKTQLSNSIKSSKHSMLQSVVVFVGGLAPQKNILSWDIGFTIVVDSGFYICKLWGLKPNIAIGDFDSVSKEEVLEYSPQTEILSFNTNKNFTDTQLALEYAHTQFMHDITIIGGMGQRLDHFLEIMSYFKQDFRPNRIIGPEYQIEYIAEHCTSTIDCSNIADKYISFFSLTEVSRQTSKGLKWDLSNIVLTDKKSSSSNEYIADHITLTMLEGALIAVFKHGGYAVHTERT